MVLLFKLVLVPALIAGVTLGTRRWGPRIGGLLTALPVAAGPTLGFYAVEQGSGFAAAAAGATLLGLVGTGAFCLAYVRTATRMNWPLSLVIGWLAFATVLAIFSRVQLSLIASLAVTLAALVAARSLVPGPQSVARAVEAPVWDLPFRMVVAAALVLALTSLATWLGPGLSGGLNAFPVATGIIAAFTHAQRGSEEVMRFFRGFLPGLCSFAVFCFVLAATLPSTTLLIAFLAAVVTQLALQGILLWRMSTARATGQLQRHVRPCRRGTPARIEQSGPRDVGP